MSKLKTTGNQFSIAQRNNTAFIMLACLLAIAYSFMTSINAGIDSGTHSSPTATDELFDAINTRLSFMQSVALYKVHNQLPIEDLDREQIVLEEALQSAASLGLKPESVRDFFQTQMQLAKVIQFRYQAELSKGQNLPAAPDLTSDIRPKLDQLSIDINTLLLGRIQTNGVVMEADWEKFNSSINDPYLTEQDKRRLFDSLLTVRAH